MVENRTVELSVSEGCDEENPRHPLTSDRDKLHSDRAGGDSRTLSTWEDAKILKLCRRASKLHFEMILTPTVLVSTRIRPGFANFYHDGRNTWKTRLVLCILGAVVVMLPGIYAHTVMPFPCKSTEVLIGRGEGEMEETEWRMEGCEVQRMLFHKPFQIGGILMTTSLLLTILMDILNRMLYCLYYGCGKPDCILNLKRLLWRPILLLWYEWIDRKIPSLKYSNDYHVFPPLYSPPSVVMCWVYLTLIFEMFMISAKSGHVTFGFVLAYGMGEVLLKLGQSLLHVSEKTEVVTNGEIRHWLPRGWAVGSTTVLDRLHELCVVGRRDLHLSSAELMSLEELDEKGATLGPSDRREGDDSLDGVGVIIHVYVVDLRLLVDVVKGTVKRLEDE